MTRKKPETRKYYGRNTRKRSRKNSLKARKLIKCKTSLRQRTFILAKIDIQKLTITHFICKVGLKLEENLFGIFTPLSRHCWSRKEKMRDAFGLIAHAQHPCHDFLAAR